MNQTKFKSKTKLNQLSNAHNFFLQLQSYDLI